MKISNVFYCWMAPWRECEMCFIGPAVLNLGDEIRLTVGLFFIEFGIVLKRKEQIYLRCPKCNTEEKICNTPSLFLQKPINELDIVEGWKEQLLRNNKKGIAWCCKACGDIAVRCCYISPGS